MRARGNDAGPACANSTKNGVLLSEPKIYERPPVGGREGGGLRVVGPRSPVQAKAYEAAEAVAAGAAEVDMVVSVGSLKEGDGPASRAGGPQQLLAGPRKYTSSTQHLHTF